MFPECFTEFYSWDASFGLVNPRLSYSCGQVVFCVNLGTFLSASCSWDGGLWASSQLKLNDSCMFPECSDRSEKRENKGERKTGLSGLKAGPQAPTGAQGGVQGWVLEGGVQGGVQAGVQGLSVGGEALKGVRNAKYNGPWAAAARKNMSDLPVVF
jgi:hypothetical protein